MERLVCASVRGREPPGLHIMFLQAMYEATINQVYTLCSLASVSSVNSGQGEFVDAAVRARIFWYAHIHEGVTTGLRGGRLLLYALTPTSFHRGIILIHLLIIFAYIYLPCY